MRVKRYDPEVCVAALKEELSAHQLQHDIQVAKADAYHEGFSAGINLAIYKLSDSNFSQDVDGESYMRGINDFLYELGKELGVGCGDLRERQISLDEKAYHMAAKIRQFFGAEDVDDTVS